MHFKLADAAAKQALVYDQIEVIDVDIKQKPRKSLDDLRRFTVLLTYRTYAIGPNNEIIYSGEGVQRVLMKDFLPFAQQKLAAGDPQYLQMFAALEGFSWHIIADHRGTTVISN